jgi:rhamnosyltransferase
MMNPEVGVAIITHNAKQHLHRCLEPLFASSLEPQILVVNSSSCDGTVEEAERLGAETLVVPRNRFNHGITRELARQTLKTPIVVMMTPDAYAASPAMLERLIAPLVQGEAVLAYARQIPHTGAELFEAFPRAFNYPRTSQLRRLGDLGVYTYFSSNSCCAYLNRALDDVGGFPHVLLGEDTLVAAMLLRKGHALAYVAEAVVHHSHAYGISQEFRRHFDIGYARREQAAFLDFGVKDRQRGWQFARQFLTTVARQQPRRLPYAGLYILAKWIGYQLGRAAIHGPRRLAAAFSSQEFYWDSECKPF